MSIEITIIYSPESVIISHSSHVFPDDGATLGRANSNFWVLDDPNKYMSSVHAKISCESGNYYLTDLSTNGTFINGATEPVGNGNQVLLNDGDHFTISDYEFVAKVTDALGATSPFPENVQSDPFASLAPKNDATSDMFNDASLDDPFGDYNSTLNNNDPFSPAVISKGVDSLMPSLQVETENDPLALLDKMGGTSHDPFAMSGLDSEPLINDILNQNQNLNHNFSQNNFHEPAFEENSGLMNDSIEWPKASPESNMIPDNWDDWEDDLTTGDSTESVNIAPVNNIQERTPHGIHNSNFAPTISEPIISNSFVQPLENDPFNESANDENNEFAQLIDSGFDYNSNNNSTHNENERSIDDLFAEPLVENEVFSQPSIENDSAPFIVPTPAQKVSTSNVQFNNTNPSAQANREQLTTPQKTDEPAVITNTHSEEEYAQLEQQNETLRNEIVALKLKLSNTQQVRPPLNVKVSADASDALNIIIQSMGLAKWNLDDAKKMEVNETVGLLMRETMQGMMQVLKFRKKIKEEFRINVTTIQSVENNPLKFSANIDDALENMFIKENNAYKAPVDAVKEGFQGIAEHQVAVVAGMQAAFRGMIERFDPNQLENRFEKYNSSGGLLGLGKKTKNWSAYKEYHKGLVENLDDSFQHLFGYDFVQAYEEQMQSLISARVTKNLKNDTTN